MRSVFLDHLFELNLDSSLVKVRLLAMTSSVSGSTRTPWKEPSGSLEAAMLVVVS